MAAMRFLKSILYLYLTVGLAFGIARFGWGALVAAMAEPEEQAFIGGVIQAAMSGGLRVLDWAPTLVMDVLMGGRDIFDWMLYS